MLDMPWLFASMVAMFAVLQFVVRWPLPINLIIAAMLGALLGGFGVPFRHLVEGGFGYLNLVLALFAGAFFGQVMRHSGASETLAKFVAAGERRFLAVFVSGALLFVTGMFTGIAGVAVLVAGPFAAPMLRSAGLRSPAAASCIALLGTLGMIAPPLNVPAMIIADGVNMPFAGFGGSLWTLSLPPAVFALIYFTRRAARDAARQVRSTVAASAMAGERPFASLGILALVVIIAFWGAIRYWPSLAFDPSIPLVLFGGSLVGLFTMKARDWTEAARSVFSGTPLLLAAVLVAVGVLVQVMSLTGVRGWLVIQAMSFQAPWIYGALVGIPLLGSVLTALGAANSLGVPFAFAFIHQDMIVNVSALSAVAALSEFCPPTAISTVLAAYVVGEERLWPIIRSALPTLLVLAGLAVLMLMFAPLLAPYLR